MRYILYIFCWKTKWILFSSIFMISLHLLPNTILETYHKLSARKIEIICILSPALELCNHSPPSCLSICKMRRLEQIMCKVPPDTDSLCLSEKTKPSSDFLQDWVPVYGPFLGPHYFPFLFTCSFLWLNPQPSQVRTMSYSALCLAHSRCPVNIVKWRGQRWLKTGDWAHE